MNTLTPAGRKWAEKAVLQGSMVAAVALDRPGNWPEAHIQTAIQVANEEAKKDV